eukprot:CAMPEP_0170187116 /NCGR_PEP_ID=MMETSP0040_2-20121228/40934_1 /TAXON_ID=641309 /ORGANISM="Lotharella oceanica, Strain CCMP622" /LENGTH=527 /DNA_ID=CAMNT_0010434065 /DNA_START=93 /DNA_END=1676 /DNA_ORIENTATION=+
MEEEVEVWFARLFVSFVPYDLVLRITDCFLSEGAKMLFRVGLAILKKHEKELLQCHSKVQFIHRLAKRMRMHTPVDELLTDAFNIRAFSRRMLSKLHATHEIREIPFAKVPVFYMPQFTAKDSKLLNVTQLRKLWKHLPALMRIQDPVLLFTTDTHGYSLDILLDRTGHQSAFIVIKTQAKSVFGVFLHWRENLAKHEIGEESFVFTLEPKISCYHYYYSDPKRWGDTKGNAIPEKHPRLGKAGSEPEDNKIESVPEMIRTQSHQPTKSSATLSSSRQIDSPIADDNPLQQGRRRRLRRSSEKGSDRVSRERVGTSSAPSSPVRKVKAPEIRRQTSEEMRKAMEVKTTQPKDLGSWRRRREEENKGRVSNENPRIGAEGAATLEGTPSSGQGALYNLSLAASNGSQPSSRRPMAAPTQNLKVQVNRSGGQSSSDQSDNEAPTQASRRRGNQLRMMDAMSGQEINLWCRRTPQWFGIGSGDRVALGIDSHLLHGVTESTTAFYNPPLNGQKYHGDFKCVAIEVWGLTH